MEPRAAPPQTRTALATPDGGGAAARLRVHGACHVYRAYDLGFAVDLDAAERLMRETSTRQTVRHRRRAPAWFQYEPLPLRITQALEPLDIAGFPTEPSVECTFFDFGAVSIAYRIPFSAELEDLLALSNGLWGNRTLLDDSRRRVDGLVKLLGPAISKVAVSELVEDYEVYAVRRWDPALGAPELLGRFAGPLAALLLAETSPLSEQQIADCLASRISFAPEDLAVIDWNAAAVFDAEPEDVLTLLEYANIELLEIRYLDNQLDRVLDESHALLVRQARRSLWPLGPGANDLRRLAELRVDSSVLFEGLNNAIKLVGDQYLARVYRLAAAKLHLPAWDGSVLRKLSTVDAIYDRISQYQTTRRLEVLEIVIILLIALSIILSFLPAVTH